jgi:oligosaccharide repeat unit polymerase
MHHLLSIVTFIFFSAYLVSKKYSVLILFIISFIVSSFIAVMTIEKAPFIWLIIGLFLTYYLSKHKGKIPITSTILLAGSVLVLLVMFYMVWSNNSNVILSLKAVFSRATIGSIQPAYYYLEFFPDQQEFLFGKSFPNPGGLLPFKPYSLTVEIMNWKFPEYIKWGVVGSMPTIFWAEAYANFNYYGVIIIPFFVGIAIWIISYLSNKIENTPIKIGLLVWLILHYKDLSITGFSGYLIDFYFIFVTVTFGIIILITNIFKIERTI